MPPPSRPSAESQAEALLFRLLDAFQLGLPNEDTLTLAKSLILQFFTQQRTATLEEAVKLATAHRHTSFSHGLSGRLQTCETAGTCASVLAADLRTLTTGRGGR